MASRKHRTTSPSPRHQQQKKQQGFSLQRSLNTFQYFNDRMFKRHQRCYVKLQCPTDFLLLHRVFTSLHISLRKSFFSYSLNFVFIAVEIRLATCHHMDLRGGVGVGVFPKRWQNDICLNFSQKYFQWALIE